MARAKTEKKTLSIVKPILVNGLIRDYAEVENRSESAIIEQIILDSLLPQNKEAKVILENYLYNENGEIGRTLAAFFGNNAAGTNWGAVHDNFLQLVQYAYSEEAFSNHILNGKEEELHHACSQIQSIIERLDKLGEENVEFKREAAWGRELLCELKEEPQCSRLSNFYALLIHNWDELKDWTITYRLLHDLVKLEKDWRNTPDARVRLLEVVKVISNDW